MMRLLLIGKHILCSHCGERSLILFPNFSRARSERPIVRPPQQHRKGY